jgi:nitrite reductase/ring-hydroxylating ferredoxin subunit
MSDWMLLAELEAIPEERLWAVECGGYPWVVIRSGLEVRCFFDRCSHQDVRLSEFAQLDAGGGILCFAHGARFCANSGTPLCFPAQRALWQADTRVEGSHVFLRIPPNLPET